MEIFSFLKKVFFVLKSVNFWWRCFLLEKKCQFVQNALVIGQMSEFLSIVIKSYCDKSFSQYKFSSKNVNFV